MFTESAKRKASRWSQKKYSFYFSALGHSCIVLPKRKKGLRLLFAMFHELGHHFARVGDEPAAAFEGMCNGKAEPEADAIALVAMMPIDMLKEMAFFDGSRYGGKLYNERLRLFFLYGI
ncbi:MAG: ImmA/IrrE family metallo-endopeptidase [Saprospiraceae bacterium]|nr:ImmA/IrrE family metallo-endopeptidase [Pyrinomonadaceae bacterium]